MSADDLGHRAAAVTGGSAGELGRHRPSDVDAVAARVPPEYRDAYLEGLARARATREHVAA